MRLFITDNMAERRVDFLELVVCGDQAGRSKGCCMGAGTPIHRLQDRWIGG
jgi:hypothetical protein